nr:hypothetical protein [Tanacetum cinerariifolium]
MLNKENYVSWSSRLLRYAKSRPNGKLIHNSIINGPYVRRMIPEPEADDQAIQTILLSLPEDIYAVVDSYETAQEIWLRVQQMMKGSDIGIQKKKANNLKFLNNLQPEWSRHVTVVHQTKDLHTADYTQLYDFMKYNQKEVDELKAERLAKIQDPLALMANSNNPYAFPAPHQDQPSFNQNYMQQPMPNPEDITDPTTTMNMALALMAKAFKLNYSTPTNNNQRISSNLRNRQVAKPGMNMGQDRQMQMVGGNADLNGNGNLVAARAEGNTAGYNGNQIRCYNCRGMGHFARNCTVRPMRRDAAYLQTQLLIAQMEEAGIQLQVEEFDLMQASTSGTQTDKAPVYDSDGSAEVHDYENCYDNEIFNMFTQEEQYTELLEPIPEPHQVPHNENNVISEVTSAEQSGETVEQHPVNFEEIHSFYHTEKKMALGYQNPFYLKQAQKKQQSLYDGKLLLEKHDPPIVHDSEETLQLAQESRQKMKQLNKEIKPANYTKINHLLGVFVSQTAKSREELYISNDYKTANVSKSISIPNEEFSDDTTPSVARKFLNEVKSTIVTLQRVVKHRITLETHNWSSSAHQELHQIVKDENFPIVNQFDARVQNFEIQFLKEATKFIGDFKSLAKEADESLAKHKALKLEIKRLLRAVVSQDIMSVVQKTSVVATSNLQTELERTQECFENCIVKKENEYAKLWNDCGTSANTKFAKQSIVENLPKVGETHALSKPVTSNSVPTSKESKVLKNDKVITTGMFRINPFKTSREAKHVPNIVRASAKTKPITVSQPPVIIKKDVNSDSNGLSFTGIDNTKTRRPKPRSNTKNDRVSSTSKSS